jgi:ketosteroid isomerase-like protein
LSTSAPGVSRSTSSILPWPDHGETAPFKVGLPPVEARGMDIERTFNQAQRERLVSRLATAFVERDLTTLERAMREDVVLVLPGSSPFAGEHHGHESVGRFLVGIRQFIISKEPSFIFVHDVDSMRVSHEISVAGPNHLVEMTLHITLNFDREERISAVQVEPSDPGLFTHVVAAAFSMA